MIQSMIKALLICIILSCGHCAEQALKCQGEPDTRCAAQHALAEDMRSVASESCTGDWLSCQTMEPVTYLEMLQIKVRLQKEVGHAAYEPPLVRLDFSNPLQWRDGCPEEIVTVEQRKLLQSEQKWVVLISSFGPAAEKEWTKFPTVHLEAKEWFGNPFKLLAVSAVARILRPDALVLVADCCDVLVLGDPFAAFESAREKKAGLEVLVGVERGFRQLSSTYRLTYPKVREKEIPFSAFPQNPYVAKLGVPNDCDSGGFDHRCLQSRFPNAGTVMGTASKIEWLYQNSWSACNFCTKWATTGSESDLPILRNVSEQNLLVSTLYTSSFCDGHCGLDYEFDMSFTSVGFSDEDLSFSNGSFQVKFPGTSVSMPVKSALIHMAGGGTAKHQEDMEILAEKRSMWSF